MPGPAAKTLAILCTGAVLAGCAGNTTPVISNTSRTNWDPKTLTYAASKGGMPVEIKGAAFAGDQPGMDKAVTAGLGRSLNNVRLPFFTERPEGYTAPYRVVMLFNPAEGAALQHLCARDLPSQGPAGDRVNVTAAYCAADKMVTRVSGHVAGVESPQSPGFRTLVTNVGLGLFLSGNRDQDAPGVFDG